MFYRYVFKRVSVTIKLKRHKNQIGIHLSHLGIAGLLIAILVVDIIATRSVSFPMLYLVPVAILIFLLELCCWTSRAPPELITRQLAFLMTLRGRAMGYLFAIGIPLAHSENYECRSLPCWDLYRLRVTEKKLCQAVFWISVILYLLGMLEREEKRSGEEPKERVVDEEQQQFLDQRNSYRN